MGTLLVGRCGYDPLPFRRVLQTRCRNHLLYLPKLWSSLMVSNHCLTIIGRLLYHWAKRGYIGAKGENRTPYAPLFRRTLYQWATEAYLVYREGVEPSTCGLRGRCSTTELSVHYLEDTLLWLFITREFQPPAITELPTCHPTVSVYHQNNHYLEDTLP